MVTEYDMGDYQRQFYLVFKLINSLIYGVFCKIPTFSPEKVEHVRNKSNTLYKVSRNNKK